MYNISLILVGSLMVTAYSEDKRQGVFGPCQGWGAGCTRYHSREQPPPPSPKITRNVPKIPNYLFTSGSSWKPIGKRRQPTAKRTSWFTDIPYLRNPFLSYPRYQKATAARYPTVFRTTSHRDRDGEIVEV